MAYPHIKKNHGKDFNHYSSTSVTWNQFGNIDGYTVDDGYGPDIIIQFSTQTVIFTNETSGQIVQYSFDGVHIHGELDGTSTSTTRIMKFDNRPISLIWFRLKSGSSGPATITVTAWGLR
jgi:hypothetical protein